MVIHLCRHSYTTIINIAHHEGSCSYIMALIYSYSDGFIIRITVIILAIMHVAIYIHAWYFQTCMHRHLAIIFFKQDPCSIIYNYTASCLLVHIHIIACSLHAIMCMQTCRNIASYIVCMIAILQHCMCASSLLKVLHLAYIPTDCLLSIPSQCSR